MKAMVQFSTIMFLVLAGSGTIASAAENQKDTKALDVLNRMAAWTASLDRFVIKGEVFADGRMDAGLIVSNPSELTIKIDRPGSLYLETFDGLNSKQINIHAGKLTVFNSDRNYYARADVPEDIKDAMKYAMEEYEIDMPLGEVLFSDSAIKLITDQDTVLYLTDKSRISGVDCHHIAIRGDEIDLQLWVEEGDKPAPRKMIMTMKWDGGSPRRIAVMDWESVSQFDANAFDWKAPDGAREIQFVGSE